MRKRILKVSVLFLCILAVFVLVLWIGVNYLIIPRFIVPMVQNYVNNNFTGYIKLRIGEVSYNPVSGFSLIDVELSGPVMLKDNTIMHTSEIDIDLDLLPLLKKTIKIKDMSIFDCDLAIGRDINGDWNMKPLADFLGSPGGESMNVILQNLTFTGGKLNFYDFSKKDSVFEKQFSDIKIYIAKPLKENYELILKARSQEQSPEILRMRINYNTEQGSFKADLEFGTKYIGTYSDYYLDKILGPWRINGRELNVYAGFDYTKGALFVNSVSDVKTCNLFYGDLKIAGDAQINANLKYTKDGMDNNYSVVNIKAENIVFMVKGDTLIDKGESEVVASNDLVNIERLAGQLKGYEFNCSGTLNQQGIILKGRLGDLMTDFKLDLYSENSGKVIWQNRAFDSYININAEFSDIKDILFGADIDGSVQISDIVRIAKGIDIEIMERAVSACEKGNIEDYIKGVILISGTISRQDADMLSFEEDITIAFKDLSVLKLNPVTFDFKLSAKEGIMEGEIPKIDFFGGTLWGSLKMTCQRWGAELCIDNFDIETFVKPYPDLLGTKGVLTFKVVCIGGWNQLEKIKGGGYFKIQDCYLWNIKVFDETEKAIKEVNKDIDLQKFKNFEGNYDIDGKGIKLENVICDITDILFNIKGSIFWQGDVDFNVWVVLSRGSTLRMMRHIFIPVTMAIDAIANCIEVHVYNKLTDLKYSAGIQPAGIFYGLFPIGSAKADPDKYNMDELWQEQPETVSQSEDLTGEEEIYGFSPRKKLQ